ncbi:MAG: AAA family ATPase [Erythrobacter sp.]
MLRRDGFLPDRRVKTNLGPWRTVATFEYADASGEVIYRTVRREPAKWDGPGKRPKEFRAERFEGGRWVAGMGDCERIPYRLPELRQAIEAGDPVYLVEGEAKADKLAAMGFAATAIAFGCKGWRADYAQHFAGARLVILPDNDVPGRSFARKVHADLKATAKAVAVVELPGLPEAGDVIDWQGSAGDLVALCANPVLPDWIEGGAVADKPASGFAFTPVGELQYRAPEFLIEGLIETETLGLVFGDPGCGKSFLGADIALSVATGAPFHGRKVKQGPVFFIAGEGHNGLARRFAAWGKARGVSIKDAPLFMSNRPAQFLDADSAKAVADAVHDLAARHGDPALIEIDTLARNFGPGDENSTSDMGQFIAAIDDLKAQFSGCAALIIHHSGHGDKGRARGAMALKGALDCEYRVAKDGSTITLSNTKMKDAEPPRPIAFELQGVELGGGASSAVLVETEAQAKVKPLTRNQQLGLHAFHKAAATSGQWADDGEFQGLALEAWREAFYASHTGDTTEAKKKAFQRARTDLIDCGRLAVAHDVYTANEASDRAAIKLLRETGTDGTNRDNFPRCPDAEAGETGTNGTRAYKPVPCPAPARIGGDDQTCQRCNGMECEFCAIWRRVV